MRAKTILVVDDEPRTRQGLKKTLDNWADGRFEIITAASGEEALAVIRDAKIQLLITDIRMPEMTGLQLLKLIENEGHKPVAIVISAYSEFDYAQEAIRFGVLNYLLKPVMKSKLIEAVEQALQVGESREHEGIIKKVVDERLIDLEKRSLQTESPIKKAMDYVNENAKEKLSMREVAEYVHLNPSYFSVLFKDQTNMTFSEYVTRRKLQNAKNLLLSTKLPIADVAEEVGYQTSKYFIKIFKEYEGKTPSQYRKELSE
ncbi:response regulator [Halalkalibacter kiskunsagensis]|uniref:Response regulator n=1 Tax=Halalkalibacter kiskunsagensis TaxID=1548599 RepID=A0ABV6K9F3_9BACI